MEKKGNCTIMCDSDKRVLWGVTRTECTQRANSPDCMSSWKIPPIPMRMFFPPQN